MLFFATLRRFGVLKKQQCTIRCLFSPPDDTRSDEQAYLLGIWFISHANDGNIDLARSINSQKRVSGAYSKVRDVRDLFCAEKDKSFGLPHSGLNDLSHNKFFIYPKVADFFAKVMEKNTVTSEYTNLFRLSVM